ncbi:hypothetical protein [Curvibacter sp. PAE-UM]|uniref:hypothetical protein n=1 Tax=Curvibacter sp. PAE-UM TaxID=1714344 RepID=UPI000B273A26|nr:hypothetical protein [Curvibacter sp. PAE-UM]
MSSASDILVFGLASDGSVEQWDGHPTPTGIMLRWFVRKELGFPELGFDIYRAQVPDTPPLPFNDLNVPLVQGKTSWTYADVLTLRTPEGLKFEPSGQIGWWQLMVVPTSPVEVRFTSPAWLVTIHANADAAGLHISGRANGVVVVQEELIGPGQTLTWRTRGLDSLDIRGEGSISFLGYHLLNQQGAWKHIAHRCLPVVDPMYRCNPQSSVSEEDDARSRLPISAQSDWAYRFSDAFRKLLPALRRLACGAMPGQIPEDAARDMRISSDERELINLAALDPHGARILGLAYDDLLGGRLDGAEYVYKVVGRWVQDSVEMDLSAGDKRTYERLEKEYGVKQTLKMTRAGARMTLHFPAEVHDFSLEVLTSTTVEWTVTNSQGGIQSGQISSKRSRLNLVSLNELSLSWSTSGRSPILEMMRWTALTERVGMLPGIQAVERGAPPGPGALWASVVPAESSSAISLAKLDWPIRTASGDAVPEGEPISYQIGHRHVGSDPTIPLPVPDPPKQTDLLYKGAPVFIRSEATQEPSPGRVLHVDRNDGAGLAPGHWAWWVRGVDLFGRVSEPSPWALAAVTDSAPPAAPILIQAEWVQRSLPPATVNVIGRSVAAQRWLNNPLNSGTENALVASWVFGPEQTKLQQDVNGFHLLFRKPNPLPIGAPDDTTTQYPDTWGNALASFGPMSIRFEGAVVANPVLNPALVISITGVHQLAPSASASPSDPVRSVCISNMELDGASGVFVGGTLLVGTTSYPVVANGDGANLTLVVEHTAGDSPIPGTAQLSAVPGTLAELSTDLPPSNSGANLRATSGVLSTRHAQGEKKLQVLRAQAGIFLCRYHDVPVAPGNEFGMGEVAGGDRVSWFPVWSAALNDTGFGPSTSEITPVAHAQVSVRAVRFIQSSAIASAPSAPLTITAVDLTVPQPPGMNGISFDPSAKCVLMASRADWYGKSRFQMGWAAQVNRQFLVYRALGDEINRLDSVEHDRGTGRSHDFSAPDAWPPGVYGDANRKARVLSELTALDAARSVVDVQARATAVAAAYDAMTIDTQMLLARQDYAWPAYVALTKEPTDTNVFEDVLDGRSHGHWFYRITSRTRAGAESPPSEPTPPICCPDVVAPSAPIAHMALADVQGNGVNLRWLASPDADTQRYEIYAEKHPEAGTELASMAPVAVHVPTPHRSGEVINFRVTRSPGDWCFWIVAIDTSENRSPASAMLRGKSLRPVPEPPVWVSAVRTPPGAPTHITLTWSHPSDQRLACLVERRPISGGYWSAASAWLPRGTYHFDDVPVDLSKGWTYRLRVRDQLGQVSLTLPTINLEAS